MFVEGLLPEAREGLVTIGDHAPLIEAAKLLETGPDLILVCDQTGTLAGVISKTDVVAEISRCRGASCLTVAAEVMTREIVRCQSKDPLHDVLKRMKERGLRNVPVVDENSQPLGVLNVRSILQALLSESESEEGILRDYVMGVGYR